MAKQRYVKDSFWTDPYIEKLSPDHKLVFLYLLTNPLANIAGIYEVRLKRMAYETGYDSEVVENILKKFTKDSKIIHLEDWIIIRNHLKHQNLGSKTAEGINRIIEETPKNIRDLFTKKKFSTPDSEEYEVYVLTEEGYPIQGVYKIPLSKVELSKVELSSIYGEFGNVKLKDGEYKKLIEKLGQGNTEIMIEELSTGIASKGYRYKNHYATILNWARRKFQDHKKSQGKTRTLATFIPQQ